MQTNNTVYRRGTAHIPARFWDIALSTKEIHAKIYDALGFFLCTEATAEFNSISREEQERVQFAYVSGFKINY